MISCFKNIKSPSVLGETDVFEVLERIKSPEKDILHKIQEARNFLKSGYKEDYEQIKKELPCFTFNFTYHHQYKLNKNIKEATGLLFLDVDNEDEVDYSNPLIFAAWKSISGRGLGILVKVEGLTLKNLKQVYSEVSAKINMPTDVKAAKATQFAIHSYDKDIYVNDDSETWYAYLEDSNEKVPSSSTTCFDEKRVNDELGTKRELRYDNIDEMNFEGRDYLFFPEEKELIASLFIPRVIFNGTRNDWLYKLGCQLRALNPNIGANRFIRILEGINNGCCEEPLSDIEMNRIIKNVLNMRTIEPILNKERRIIFNPNSKLTNTEKRRIINQETGALRRRKTHGELIQLVRKWDFEKHGKITQKKLQFVSGRNIKTVRKYYKLIKDEIDFFNSEYK